MEAARIGEGQPDTNEDILLGREFRGTFTNRGVPLSPWRSALSAGRLLQDAEASFGGKMPARPGAGQKQHAVFMKRTCWRKNSAVTTGAYAWGDIHEGGRWLGPENNCANPQLHLARCATSAMCYSPFRRLKDGRGDSYKTPTHRSGAQHRGQACVGADPL